MADLKVIPRQILTQPMDLGGSNEFSRMQSALNTLSSYASGKASELFTEQAAIQGKELALQKRGIPQELMPNVNAATSAYNNAYNEMTAGLLSVRLNELLSNNLSLKSNPNTLGPKSVAELNALNNATWQGFEKEIPTHMRADMEYSFLNGSAKTLDSLAGTLSKFNQANIEKDLKIVGDNAKSEYAATILTGDKKQESQALSKVIRWLDNASTLNGMTDVQKQDQLRQIQDIAIDGHVHLDMMESVIKEGEQGLSKYITKVLNSTPQQLGVTPAQKQIMVESALKYNTDITKQMNVASTQGYNNIVLESIQNPGAITSIPQLNAKIEEQAQKGFPLTETQQIQLSAKVLGKNKEAAKRAQSNAEINEFVSSGDIGIVNVSGTKINDYWEDLLKGSMEKVKSLEENGTLKPGQAKLWQMESQAALNIQRDVPALTARLEARLTGPNSNNIQDGIRQYSFLKTNNALSIQGINKKTEAFALTVLDKAQNVKDPVTIEQIISEAKEGVLNADERVVEARIAAYREFAKKNPNAVDTQIRAAMGLSRGLMKDFSFAGNIPDFQRARYNRILETNIPLYETKDQQLAFKKTNEEFKNIYKTDPGFAPKGMTVSNAISNLPWAKTTGPMNSNQAAQAISQIIDVNSKFPGKTGFTLEPSTKMPKFPATVSEKEKLEKQFAPDGHWMKVNGVDRKIYLMSPNYSSTNPFAPNAYQVYWGDTGADGKSPESIRPLTTMITKKLPNGKEEASMGPALVTIYPPNDYIPNLYKKQQNTAASTGFNLAAFNAIDQANPIKLKDFFGGFTEDAALANAAKLIETKNKKVTKEIPDKAKAIKEQFELEKLVRDELARVKREEEGK